MRRVRTFAEAIHDDPFDPSAYNGRAAALISPGRYRSAIVDLDQAIRLDAEYSQAYNNRAEAYKALGE